MKVLAVIPARGGSKRVPGKNIRDLGGKPLVAWTIETARTVRGICDCIVSTDDAAIANAARMADALVPWLRPAELATDVATSAEVCIHALDWYEGVNGSVDGVLLLSPTTPFRKVETVQTGIEMFAREPRTVLGVSPAKSHPMWCFRIDNQSLKPFIDLSGVHVRSQDLPKAYVVNGSFYLTRPDELRRSRTFYSDNIAPLVADSVAESLDIDDESDWLIAEALLRARPIEHEPNR
jgi:CMP-N,N'-diacetyllegionaminic acid synthase